MIKLEQTQSQQGVQDQHIQQEQDVNTQNLQHNQAKIVSKKLFLVKEEEEKKESTPDYKNSITSQNQQYQFSSIFKQKVQQEKEQDQENNQQNLPEIMNDNQNNKNCNDKKIKEDVQEKSNVELDISNGEQNNISCNSFESENQLIKNNFVKSNKRSSIQDSLDRDKQEGIHQNLGIDTIESYKLDSYDSPQQQQHFFHQDLPNQTNQVLLGYSTNNNDKFNNNENKQQKKNDSPSGSNNSKKDNFIDHVKDDEDEDENENENGRKSINKENKQESSQHQVLDSQLLAETKIPSQSQDKKQTQIKEIQTKINVQENLRCFIFQPISQNNKEPIQFYIIREQSGLSFFAPRYHLFSKANNMHILSARKEAVSISSSYVLSTNHSNFSTKSDSFIGKVQADILEDTYQIFDTGKNKQKKKGELGLIHIYKEYQQKISNIQVGIPKLNKQGQIEPIMLINNRQCFFNIFQEPEIIKSMLIFKNKKPVYNEIKNTYTLNFQGKNAQPSTKNFQIISSNQDDQQIYLQMAKQEENKFYCDIAWPFSIMQGFGICMTIFDYNTNQ